MIATIYGIKTNCSPGVYGITAKTLQNIADVVADKLSDLYKKHLERRWWAKGN